MRKVIGWIPQQIVRTCSGGGSIVVDYEAMGLSWEEEGKKKGRKRKRKEKTYLLLSIGPCGSFGCLCR